MVHLNGREVGKVDWESEGATEFSICLSPTWFSTGKGQSGTSQTEDSLNVIHDGDRKRGERQVFHLPDGS